MKLAAVSSSHPERGRRKREQRAKTVSLERATKAWHQEHAALGDGKWRRLPLTRGECIDGPRPCPFVSCRHHLFLDVVHGSIKLNFPDLEPHELELSCSLDLAELGELTLEQVGAALNVTRERIRQLEEKARTRAARQLRLAKLNLEQLLPAARDERPLD